MEIYHGESYHSGSKLRQEFTELAAIEGQRKVGLLLSTIDPHLGHILHEVSVEEDARRQGIATQLVSEYVDRLGSGTKVTGWIFNRETLETLRDAGTFVRAASDTGYMYINQRDFLDSLPIVQMLQAGGLPVSNLWVRRREYNPSTFDPDAVRSMSLRELVDNFAIEFNAKTP